MVDFLDPKHFNRCNNILDNSNGPVDPDWHRNTESLHCQIIDQELHVGDRPSLFRFDFTILILVDTHLRM